MIRPRLAVAAAALVCTLSAAGRAGLGDQDVYLKAFNSDALDSFGATVSISGDTVVVGAPGEDSMALGVNGDGSSNTGLGVDSGAAYVFVRNGSTWTQQAFLKASSAGQFNSFGFSVAIDGDTVVVGAPLEDSNATGVNGDELNNLSSNSGAAYVFVRSGSTWSQQAFLKASNTGAEDWFGTTVAISGDTILVAAPFEDSNSAGVNGDPNNNLAHGSGAVYVFVRNGTTWSQQAYLKSSNPDVNDLLGWASIAVDGDTVVAGASGEDSSSGGVNGNQADNGAFAAGAAYVFVRNGTTWSQQAYLKAGNPLANAAFGNSVTVSGDTVAVGARGEDTTLLGGTNSAGACHVFVRSGTTWSPQAHLLSSNQGFGDAFGRAVALAGDTLAVSAAYEDGPSDTKIDSGAVHLFRRTGSSWSLQAYLQGSNTDAFDYLGEALAISGDRLVAGAAGESSDADGVDGNQADNSAGSAGAAYVFNVPCGTISSFGAGCAGSGGFTPSLAVAGCAAGGGTLFVGVSGGLGGAPTLLLLAPTAGAQPVGGGCTLLAGPTPLIALPGVPLAGAGPGAGTLNFSSVLPAPLAALTIVLQVAVGDAANPIGFTLTNGAQIVLP